MALHDWQRVQLASLRKLSEQLGAQHSNLACLVTVRPQRTTRLLTDEERLRFLGMNPPTFIEIPILYSAVYEGPKGMRLVEGEVESLAEIEFTGQDRREFRKFMRLAEKCVKALLSVRPVLPMTPAMASILEAFPEALDDGGRRVPTLMPSGNAEGWILFLFWLSLSDVPALPSYHSTWPEGDDDRDDEQSVNLAALDKLPGNFEAWLGDLFLRTTVALAWIAENVGGEPPMPDPKTPAHGWHAPRSGGWGEHRLLDADASPSPSPRKAGYSLAIRLDPAGTHQSNEQLITQQTPDTPVRKYRNRHKNAKTRIAFMEYMENRETATLLDIAHAVHGDDSRSNNSIMKNVDRVNRDLEGIGIAMRFNREGEHIVKVDRTWPRDRP